MLKQANLKPITHCLVKGSSPQMYRELALSILIMKVLTFGMPMSLLSLSSKANTRVYHFDLLCKKQI